jgi:DNA ligase-associated metallophosphoesterase
MRQQSGGAQHAQSYQKIDETREAAEVPPLAQRPGATDLQPNYALSEQQTETHLLRFGGKFFEPLPSGGLYWRAERTLLVADLHLEKFSSYARSGQLLPPYDTTQTLRRLAADIAFTGAETIISLGDSFHRDEGTGTLLDHDRTTLAMLMAKTNWLWLSGNHDPSPHALGGQCLPFFERGGVTLAHEPRRDATGLIAGHLHPAARIVINGRSTRRPCFVHDARLLILPAYGSSTGSINILGPAFAGLFARENLQVTMLGQGRLYPVSTRRLING